MLKLKGISTKSLCQSVIVTKNDQFTSNDNSDIESYLSKLPTRLDFEQHTMTILFLFLTLIIFDIESKSKLIAVKNTSIEYSRRPNSKKEELLSEEGAPTEK